MTIVLNAILAIAVIVMVVSPLAWAIRTQHRDAPAAAGGAGQAARTARPRRRPRRAGAYAPLRSAR